MISVFIAIVSDGLFEVGEMKTKLVIMLYVIVLSGCATTYEMQAKIFRDNAFAMSERGQYDQAISTAIQGLKRAQSVPLINNELIELYDDLGLYHYQKKDYQSSVYYQSIATVLSYYDAPESDDYKTYLQRLGWAYSKYKPGFNFVEISKSSLALVCNKQNRSIRDNYDIKRFLYKRSSKNKHNQARLKSEICFN